MPLADPLDIDISVIVPVLNDRVALVSLLGMLERLAPPSWEVLVVDGGSDDGSGQEPARFGATMVEAEACRGLQQDLGYLSSSGRLLWFLHADTRLDEAAVVELERVYAATVCHGRQAWGRFNVRLESDSRRGGLLGLVATLMNWRSRLTGICTGDQGIFASRDLLVEIGGVPRQPLMEDVELSKRLKAIRSPMALGVPLGASSRRWDTHGLVRTIVVMWNLRLRYFLGASPELLARRYYR